MVMNNYRDKLGKSETYQLLLGTSSVLTRYLNCIVSSSYHYQASMLFSSSDILVSVLCVVCSSLPFLSIFTLCNSIQSMSWTLIHLLLEPSAKMWISLGQPFMLFFCLCNTDTLPLLQIWDHVGAFILHQNSWQGLLFRGAA